MHKSQFLFTYTLKFFFNKQLIKKKYQKSEIYFIIEFNIIFIQSNLIVIDIQLIIIFIRKSNN